LVSIILSLFFRALQLVFISDCIEYVLNHVTDITLNSNIYEGHVTHLDALLGKLTMAGFIINIDECDICKQEIKFVDHFMNDRQVMLDTEKIVAIFIHPSPRNRKHLTHFLATCSYHRFIIN